MSQVYRVPGESYSEQLYIILCDYYWCETHKDREHEVGFHRDDQGEAFAERVMEFVKKELGQ